MSSPFSTVQEFNGAVDGPTEGAIYTFAQTPAINTIALLLSVGLFIWFMTKTYHSQTKPSSVDKSLNQLSTFIVVGLLSVIAAEQRYPAEAKRAAAQRVPHSAFYQQVSKASSSQAPLGLLGMVGAGAFHQLSGQTSKRGMAQRRKRSSRR
jgi:hypothetical protein